MTTKKNVEKYVYEVEKLNYKFSFILLWILPEIIKQKENDVKNIGPKYRKKCGKFN